MITPPFRYQIRIQEAQKKRKFLDFTESTRENSMANRVQISHRSRGGGQVRRATILGSSQSYQWPAVRWGHSPDQRQRGPRPLWAAQPADAGRRRAPLRLGDRPFQPRRRSAAVDAGHRSKLLRHRVPHALRCGPAPAGPEPASRVRPDDGELGADPGPGIVAGADPN